MDRTPQEFLRSRGLQPGVSRSLKRKATEAGIQANSRAQKAARGNVYGDVHVGDQANAVVGDVVHHHHHHHHHQRCNAEGSYSQHAKQSFMESLVYPGMTQRINDIPVEHEGTFEWIFDDSTPHKWSNFSQWLSGDEKFYWVSGKAGSGKSTLMKMMWSHAETEALLQRNSINACILKHSFWLPGASFQKNFKGLLLSLVSQLLSLNNVLVEQLLTERKEFRTKKDITSWSLEELSRLSKYLLCGRADSSTVCVFLDGLDEIETPEDQEHVLDFLDDLTTRRTMKICVSSRIEEPWASRFRACSRLRLQDLTRTDITRYARAKLQRAWSRGDSTRVANQQLDDIVWEISDRAKGVFLWARLAVVSLLRISTGASAREISARLDRMPNEIVDLYRDMLRRRNEEPASVIEEAASYLKLLVDPWGVFQGLHKITVRLCVALRRSHYENNVGGNALLTPSTYLSECDQMEDRISDICAGMVTLVGSPFDASNDTREVEYDQETHRYGDVRLEFHHRSVLDFLRDHVDGRAFLENSKISETELFTAYVNAENLYQYQSTFMSVPTMLSTVGRFHDHCPTVSDFDKAQAVRQLFGRMTPHNLNLEAIDVADAGRIKERLDIFEDFYSHGMSCPHARAIDLVGRTLERGIPSIFNTYVAQYLAPTGADGLKLSKKYMDHLLGCSTNGDLPEVAVQLVRAGADLHTLQPRTSGCCWLRRMSDGLIDMFFGPREGLSGRVRSCRRERLHAWKQVLAEHHVRSSFSIFRGPYDMRSLSVLTGDYQDKSRLMMIDIGRCCEIVKKDIESRGPGDVTRAPYEVAPNEHIGFAINPSSGEAVPVQLETLQFMVCRKEGARLNCNSDAIDYMHQQTLHFGSWERPQLEEEETGDPLLAQELRDLELREKAEMFWTRARELALMDSHSANVTAAQISRLKFELA